MLKADHISVMNLENAMRGARNPLNSWAKSDSAYDETGNYILGENDLSLATRLCAAGSDHRKFIRQIMVSMDITAPLYWWKEFDTYKVGTVANSTSTMHKIHAKPFELADFSTDHMTQESLAEFEKFISYIEAVRVRYMETIRGKSYGIGHYEPLRHYAEVHLKIEEGKRGSGITFESVCHVDDLTYHWQRLIESHIFERTHKGVLIGAPLTDIHVTLLIGRAHLKHTEGGDFRQATYRALRNALMQAQSVLLEPVCRFEMRAPADSMGRLMGDLNRMRAKTEPVEFMDDEIRIAGEAVFSLLNGYQTEFAALTHGRGALTWQLDHYEPCAEAEAIIEERAYRPLADEPADSVFCAKGAGFAVAWDRVREFAHLNSEANP